MSNVVLEGAATPPARTATRVGLLRGFGSMREFGLPDEALGWSQFRM